jgi:hypothetical protein
VVQINFSIDHIQHDTKLGQHSCRSEQICSQLCDFSFNPCPIMWAKSSSNKKPPSSCSIELREKKRESKTNKKLILLTTHLFTGSCCKEKFQIRPRPCSPILISPCYHIILGGMTIATLRKGSSHLLPVWSK